MENKKQCGLLDFLQSENFLQSELITQFRKQIVNNPEFYEEYQLSRLIYTLSGDLAKSFEAAIDEDKSAKDLPKGLLNLKINKTFVKHYLKMIAAYAVLELERLENEKD